MSNIHRYYFPNAMVFITCVTHNRKSYLQSEENLNLFWETLKHVKDIHPFRLFAYVILPDHFHWLMQVEDKTGNFSKVIQSIKRNFTLNFKKRHQISESLNIWQKRYWDHVIRSEIDLEKHFDYIHWNPIRHGYVLNPEDWLHSSFSFWYERGFIKEGWGIEEEPQSIIDMNFE